MLFARISNTKDHFSLYQEISRKYAEVYLPFEEQMLTLQHHGKKWEVRCRVKKSKAKRLLRGRKHFARDNNLQLGDVCLFELLRNKKKYVMNVHIIRKSLYKRWSLAYFLPLVLTFDMVNYCIKHCCNPRIVCQKIAVRWIISLSHCTLSPGNEHLKKSWPQDSRNRSSKRSFGCPDNILKQRAQSS